MVHTFFISLVLSEIIFAPLDKFPITLFGAIGLLITCASKNVKIWTADLAYFFFLGLSLTTALSVSFRGHTISYLMLFLLQYGLYKFVQYRLQQNTNYLEHTVGLIIKWSVFVGAVGIADFLAFEFGYDSPVRDYYYSNKIDSFYAGPNAFGAMTAMALISINYFNPYKKKIYYIVAYAILLLALILSGSRMALLIPLVYIAILGIGLKRFLCVGGLIVFIAIISLLTKEIDTEFVSIILNKRYELWLEAIRLWKSSVALGIGTGNFQLTNELQFNESIGSQYGLHSMYLWLLVECGILGLLAYSAFLLLVFSKPTKSNNANFLRTGLLILLFSQLTEFYLDHEELITMFYWILISGVMHFSRIPTKSETEVKHA